MFEENNKLVDNLIDWKYNQPDTWTTTTNNSNNNMANACKLICLTELLSRITE